MTVESGLVAFLAAKTDLVSARIYPQILPETCTFPALTYQLISAIPDYDLTGPSDLTQARIQITIWGRSAAAYLDVKTLAAKVKGYLSGYSGTWGSLEIQGVFLEGEMDVMVISPEANILQSRAVQVDATILYR